MITVTLGNVQVTKEQLQEKLWEIEQQEKQAKLPKPGEMWYIRGNGLRDYRIVRLDEATCKILLKMQNEGMIISAQDDGLLVWAPPAAYIKRGDL